MILYPTTESKKVKELSLEEISKIKNVIAIDCTWNQTSSILASLNDQGKKYKFVKLEDYYTTFWRY